MPSDTPPSVPTILRSLPPIKELLEVDKTGGTRMAETSSLRNFDEDTGRVVLRLQGACDGHPSSSVTLKAASNVMHYIRKSREVVQADPDASEDTGLRAFESSSSGNQQKLEQHLELMSW
jgi:Fe-S cluster biogenesis protein NfuA